MRHRVDAGSLVQNVTTAAGPFLWVSLGPLIASRAVRSVGRLRDAVHVQPYAVVHVAPYADNANAATPGCDAIAYAFWRIQAQPLATVAQPPLDRPARRRAAKARLPHESRIVMLRRSSPQGRARR